MSIDVIPALAAKALDGLWVRQAATAQNIANAGADRYTPVRVSFEETLRQAWGNARVSNDVGSITALVPRMVEDTSIGLDTVRLDREIASASETSARFAMLTGMVSRMHQLDDMAVKGG